MTTSRKLKKVSITSPFQEHTSGIAVSTTIFLLATIAALYHSDIIQQLQAVVSNSVMRQGKIKVVWM